ncbi:MAG: hypothetical protein KC587_16490 [Nitrospira sp.]|nr:hypothetical protein [Nitrospira sp.]
MEIEDKAHEIKKEAERALNFYQKRLEDHGISWSTPTLEVLDQNPKTYTSELRIYFYKDKDLFDAFEFFIYQNGALVVSKNEVRQWIQENAEDLLAQQENLE